MIMYNIYLQIINIYKIYKNYLNIKRVKYVNNTIIDKLTLVAPLVGYVCTVKAYDKALSPRSLDMSGLSLLMRSASFSASKIHTCNCRSVGFGKIDSTVTKISVSIVKYPLRTHSATFTCLSKADSTLCKLITVAEILVAYSALSICFFEYSILRAPPHLGQHAPGAVNPKQSGFFNGGHIILSNRHLGFISSDMGPTA